MENTEIFQGLFWGISLSIPLWIAIIGWIHFALLHLH